MRTNLLQLFILTATVSVGGCSSGSDATNTANAQGGKMGQSDPGASSGGASTTKKSQSGGAKATTTKSNSDPETDGGAENTDGEPGGAENGGADSAGGTSGASNTSSGKTPAGGTKASGASTASGGTKASNTSANVGGTKATVGAGGTKATGGTKAAGGTTSTGPRGPCSPPLSYRNLFAEVLSKSNTEVNTKVDNAVQQLFHGTNNVYYESGDGAYILDVEHNDVRSEGNSYGMMIAVQMDKQTEFDKIWTWAKAHTRRSDGLFAWQASPSGSIIADYPAPDGDEYFATALIFAANRWGGNYASEAKTLLAAIKSQEFNSQHNLVNFGPGSPSNTYTDASYMLPAFYEVWACFDTANQSFWKTAASAARSFFQKNTDASTGLAPDYAEFSGAARNGSNFGPDAWRVPMNIMMDHHFFGVDSWQTTYATRLAAFWTKEGAAYGDKYTLTGSKLNDDHGAGLTGMNATLGFGLPAADGKPFVQALWSVPLPSGTYRYYDGMLYLLAMLHVSGKFHLYY